MKKKFPAVMLILHLLALGVLIPAFLLSNNNSTIINILFAAAIALIFSCIVYALIYSRNSMRRISKMNQHLESSAAEFMNSLPAPVAVIDDNPLSATDKAVGECGMDRCQAVEFKVELVGKGAVDDAVGEVCLYRPDVMDAVVVAIVGHLDGRYGTPVIPPIVSEGAVGESVVAAILEGKGGGAARGYQQVVCNDACGVAYQPGKGVVAYLHVI